MAEKSDHIINKPKFYSGWRLIFLNARVSFGKYFLQRKKYPLFLTNPFKNEFLKTIKLRRKLKLTKVIKFNNKIFASLVVPSYPSKAFDNMVANWGLNFTLAGTKYKHQIDSAFLAITPDCNLKCKHCYEQHNINQKKSLTIENWKNVIEKLQAYGTSVIIFTGGEPMLEFDKTIELLKFGNKDLSDFHIHTSGYGVTIEKAKELKKARLTAAAIGLDDVNPARHDLLRRCKGAFEMAVYALKCFNEAGIFTYVNTCATKEFIYSGDLWKFYELIKNLNVNAIQLLEPRPYGGFFSENGNVLLTDSDRKILTNFFIEGNSNNRYRDYPLIYYVAYIEGPEKMGCTMGGLSHFYIDSLGNVNPCVFMPVTFGNILNEDFDTIYSRMRNDIPKPIHKACPSILMSNILRTKVTEGGKFPIPIEGVKKEWKEILFNN
jgi:MoaA/NifB/PqqE/SkfB family radical SAM enzyme